MIDDHSHRDLQAGGDEIGVDAALEALARIRKGGLPVLVAGSLYLAGEVLRLNGEFPD